MTQTPRFQPSLPRICRVLSVGLPGAQLLDVVGPLEVFDVANQYLSSRGKPPAYRLELGAPAGKFRSGSGLHLGATSLGRASPPHTLLIGGSLGMAERIEPESHLKPLRRLARGAERVVSVCAGAFVLGQLGLLDGRRCTTHWLALPALRSRFPRAQVEPDSIYTEDGRVYTSAGITAGLDLALHLLERDLGASVALSVARLMVFFLHRPGGQSQFSASLRMRSGRDERIRKVMAFVVAHPGDDLGVATLAHRAAMSSRNFARVFGTQAGTGPASFVENVRLDAARAQLELTDHTVDAVAQDCGFGTGETLRRVFQRQLKVSPTAYRQRFGRPR